MITLIFLLVFFALLFLLAEHYGFLQEELYKDLLLQIRFSKGGQLLVAGCVIVLLFIDILLPVPSSIVMALSGKFLGPWWGALASFTGAMLAAWAGYLACRHGGDRLFKKLKGDEDTRRVSVWFEQYGIYALVLSRPVPMLTEILSCLAGLTYFKFTTFSMASALGTLPVCLVYSVAGNAGSITDPWPVIWVSLAIPAAGWCFVRYLKHSRPSAKSALSFADIQGERRG
jgi:uncharacterized membrane protein YdjX (TVP38/TMEM64 family)